MEGSRDISESNENGIALEKNYQVLILGAGRMCEPAVRHLTSTKGRFRFREASYVDNGLVDECVSVVVASLYIEDAQRVRFLTSPISGRC